MAKEKLGVEQKIDLLYEKISNEPNSLKRVYFVIKLNMILAMLDRQIALNEIRDNADIDRNDILNQSSADREESRSKLVKLNKEIRFLQEQLDPLYDVDNPNFIFGHSEIERAGSKDNLIEELENSDNLENNEAGNRIKENQRIKAIISEKETELEALKSELDGLNKDESEEIKQINKNETKALMVQKGKNFGRWFKDTYNILKDNIRQMRKEKAARKVIKKYNKNRKKYLDFQAKIEEKMRKKGIPVGVVATTNNMISVENYQNAQHEAFLSDLKRNIEKYTATPNKPSKDMGKEQEEQGKQNPDNNEEPNL